MGTCLFQNFELLFSRLFLAALHNTLANGDTDANRTANTRQSDSGPLNYLPNCIIHLLRVLIRFKLVCPLVLIVDEPLEFRVAFLVTLPVTTELLLNLLNQLT